MRKQERKPDNEREKRMKKYVARERDRAANRTWPRVLKSQREIEIERERESEVKRKEEREREREKSEGVVVLITRRPPSGSH